MKMIPVLPGCVIAITYLEEDHNPLDDQWYLFYTSCPTRFAVLEVEHDYYTLIPLDWKIKNPIRMDKWRIEHIEMYSRPSWYTDELAEQIMERVSFNASK